jgi:hypothetical protein
MIDFSDEINNGISNESNYRDYHMIWQKKTQKYFRHTEKDNRFCSSFWTNNNSWLGD